MKVEETMDVLFEKVFYPYMECFACKDRHQLDDGSYITDDNGNRYFICDECSKVDE